jgi:hypothetical protein
MLTKEDIEYGLEQYSKPSIAGPGVPGVPYYCIMRSLPGGYQKCIPLEDLLRAALHRIQNEEVNTLKLKALCEGMVTYGAAFLYVDIMHEDIRVVTQEEFLNEVD